MKKHTQGLIITHPPYGSENARQALDMALAFAAFEQPVTIVFQGNGLWNLIANTPVDDLGLKQWTATIGELSQYDIDDIVVCQDELAERRLSKNQFCIPVQVYSRDDFRQKIQTLEQLWVF